MQWLGDLSLSALRTATSITWKLWIITNTGLGLAFPILRSLGACPRYKARPQGAKLRIILFELRMGNFNPKMED